MRLTGRKQAGEGVVRGAAAAADPLGLGEVGTSLSVLPVLLPRPDSIVIVMLSSVVLMLTIVGSGDSHLGIVIIESAGGGFTTETVIDSCGEHATGAGSSFLEGGGGIMP